MANVSIDRLHSDQPPQRYRVEVDPDLQAELELYAAAYEQDYGTKPKMADLIPALVAQFLAKDRDFKKYKRDRRREAREARAEAPHSGAMGGVQD